MFDEWYEKRGQLMDSARGYLEAAWNAAMEQKEPPEGYYKLDIDWESRPWAVEVRVGYCTKDMQKNYPSTIGDRICTIPRPKPKWEPKDGEAVLFPLMGIARAGIYFGGRVYFDSASSIPKDMKPFDINKIAKTWEEINARP